MHLRNSSDKGISVGENSVVYVYDSDISNGNFGIAIKDASKLTVTGTTITGSKTGIGVYSKKPYYVRPDFDITQNDVQFRDVRVEFNPMASPD
jgi:nitrous oxidase accessory protein NosD